MTKIIRLEGPVSDIRFLNDESATQNHQEDMPDRLAFNVDDQVIHFINNEEVPLKNGDPCIVAGCLRKDVVQVLALKHIETGQVTSADADKIKKLGRWITLIGILVFIVWSIALLSMYKISWLSSPLFFVLGLLPLIAAVAAIWFGKKYFTDEAALIEKARTKIKPS